jgi:hypothetical protein
MIDKTGVRHTTTSPPQRHPDARAVSDVVGYVLVFALILGATIPILAVGTAELEDRRDRVYITGGARSMAAFAEELDTIRRSESRGGTVVFHTGSGELTIEPTTTVTLEQVDSSGRQVGIHVTRRVGSVVYGLDDTVSGYESGLRFRTDNTGTVRHGAPPIVTGGGSTDRTVVTIVSTRPVDGATATTRTGTVRVRASVVDRRRLELPESTVDPHAIRLRIDSPRAATWADALRAVDGVTVDESATTPAAVVATFGRDATVSVRVVIVEISLEGQAAGGPRHPRPAGGTDVQLNTRDG